MAGDVGVEARSLPKDPSWVSRKIKEVARDLPAHGWKVSLGHSGLRSIEFIPCAAAVPARREFAIVEGVDGVQGEEGRGPWHTGQDGPESVGSQDELLTLDTMDTNSEHSLEGGPDEFSEGEEIF